MTGLKPHDRAAFELSKGGGVVISQIYGGGGNSGATYRNDFIELHNTGPAEVNIGGWTVQYASAGGNSWTNKTNLSGVIPPGGYFLIQEAAGSGGRVDLPTPDLTGSINLSGTSGKVALVNSTTILSGTCPTDGIIVDLVGFGSSASCFEGSGRTGTLSNTTAAIRKTDGNQDTNDNSADFEVAAPAPRNSASTPHGGGGVVAGPLAHVVIAGATSVERGRTATLTVTLQDASNVSIADSSATYTWTSSDESIATVAGNDDNTATVTGAAVGGPITISVSATLNGVTESGTARLEVIPRVLGHMTLSAGTSPLVVGYQTQLFVGGTDDSDQPIDFSSITWSSSDPGIISIDNRGLITAAGDGIAVLKAQAPDGSFVTLSMSTEVPIYNRNARLGHNTEFGTPVDGEASNDVIIAREQYTISYNPQRGGPNWVSWDLSQTHLGSRNRCNCYSADTALVRLGYGQYMYTTLDYTGSGYDRGHMEPSADQTATDGENARTFFLTNFLPQKHGLNAGPWEDLENELRDSVRADREAYIIAGGIFTNGTGLGTLNNAGRIAIPDSTWKIVVMMPAGTGIDNVTSASDVNVFAVNMPNVDNPGSNNWRDFRTTVAKIQASTGYDFLSALPEGIECQVERNCAPVVNAFAGATILVGETYAASGTFTDAADDSWTGTANYGDGTTQPLAISGNTFQLSHRYASAGTFTVTATVRDQLGASGSATAHVQVQSSETGVENLSAMLATLTGVNVTSLQAKLGAAARQLASGHGTPAANQIGAFENELRALVIAGRVSRADAAPLLDYAARVMHSIR